MILARYINKDNKEIRTFIHPLKGSSDYETKMITIDLKHGQYYEFSIDQWNQLAHIKELKKITLHSYNDSAPAFNRINKNDAHKEEIATIIKEIRENSLSILAVTYVHGLDTSVISDQCATIADLCRRLEIIRLALPDDQTKERAAKIMHNQLKGGWNYQLTPEQYEKIEFIEEAAQEMHEQADNAIKTNWEQYRNTKLMSISMLMQEYALEILEHIKEFKQP